MDQRTNPALAENHLRPFRILLIEDNAGDIYLLLEGLKETGIEYTLDVAENGRQAMKSIGNAASGESPDLIVLDLNIPQHDGTELLQSIRSNSSLVNVPVVVLTSSDSPRDRESASRLGANLYLRKPSNLDDFLAIGKQLKRFLEEPGRSQPATCPKNENT